MTAHRASRAGPRGSCCAGALWDTRDDESDPDVRRRGGGGAARVRPGTGSRYQYAGVTLSERRYIKITARGSCFAQRLALDMLFGEVPFFEWSTTGGVNVSEGIGGMSSVRGIERNRFAGNVKVFSNSELRFQVAGCPSSASRWRWARWCSWTSGRVWHPGVDGRQVARVAPGRRRRLRFSRRAAVVRMDYARSTETGRQRFYITSVTCSNGGPGRAPYGFQ